MVIVDGGYGRFKTAQLARASRAPEDAGKIVCNVLAGSVTLIDIV